MRRFAHLIVAVFVVVTLSRVMAQVTAEQEVRRANDEILLAAAVGDKAVYTRLLGDDLRWIDGNGRRSSKAERIAGLMADGNRVAPRRLPVSGATASLFTRRTMVGIVFMTDAGGDHSPRLGTVKKCCGLFLLTRIFSPRSTVVWTDSPGLTPTGAPRERRGRD